MLTIGYDIGSSFVKAAVLDSDSGMIIAQASFPDTEMKIESPKPGWAEQHPLMWWDAVKNVTLALSHKLQYSLKEIKAIGIAYQMHGLVLTDESCNPLRSSIIWCDSRAVEIGEKAFNGIGRSVCLKTFLNSPGNFTASKLKWVQENEPDVYHHSFKALLPGDFIALKFTGQFSTTISGLSEGIMWDFVDHSLGKKVLDYYQLRSELIPDLVPSIGVQGYVTREAAQETGLPQGIPVSYRAGDQPNNALSLHAFEPGEIAATAGTSGVVYAISDSFRGDDQSRINLFAHSTHTKAEPRIGVLLCINGAGISNSWIRKITGEVFRTYESIDAIASKASIGSQGLSFLPFGNGAERMLCNKEVGAHLCHIHFNLHAHSDIFRAVQEGVAFSFAYGLDIMQSIGIQPRILKAAYSNMFSSEIFCRTLSTVCDMNIELYNTDGSHGAARAAAVGAGLVPSMNDVFANLKMIKRIEPDPMKLHYVEAYHTWMKCLHKFFKTHEG